MKISFLVVLMGVLPALSLAREGTISPVRGAQVPTTSPGKREGQNSKRLFRFEVKNVAPSVVAYWLDAENHEAPAEFGDAGPLQSSSVRILGEIPLVSGLFSNERKATSFPPPGVRLSSEVRPELFHLPVGVDRIIAVDAQKVVLAVATPEGAKLMAERIALLDKPLERVEMEARFVTLARQDAKKIAPDSWTTNPIQRVDKRADVALEGLLKEGKAKVVSSSRFVTLINRRVSLNNGYDNGVDQFVPSIANVPQSVTKDLLYRDPLTYVSVHTSYDVQVSPTMNADGSMTALVRLVGQERIKHSATKADDASLTLLEGETIACRSIPWPEELRTGGNMTIVLMTWHGVRDARK